MNRHPASIRLCLRALLVLVASALLNGFCAPRSFAQGEPPPPILWTVKVSSTAKFNFWNTGIYASDNFEIGPTPGGNSSFSSINLANRLVAGNQKVALEIDNDTLTIDYSILHDIVSSPFDDIWNPVESTVAVTVWAPLGNLLQVRALSEVDYYGIDFYYQYGIRHIPSSEAFLVCNETGVAVTIGDEIITYNGVKYGQLDSVKIGGFTYYYTNSLWNYFGRVASGSHNLSGRVTVSAQNLTSQPSISIVNLSPRTFIATDTITLKAKLSNGAAGIPVKWTVEGRGAASDITTGFPTQEVHTTDGSGVSTFSFTPSGNPAFVNNRCTEWVRGSKQANTPISFAITAQAVMPDGTVRNTSLAASGLGPLAQDDTDRLRQEYYDYDIEVPGRSEVVASLGAAVNGADYGQGPYGVQLSVDLPGHRDSVLAAYRGRQVMVNVTFNGQLISVPVTIPANAPVSVSSGYRNPQYNKASKSKYTKSKHIRGRALDLVPRAISVIAQLPNGQTQKVMLSLHGTLYPALLAAAKTVGTAITEQGAIWVPVGDTRENHVHVQW